MASTPTKHNDWYTPRSLIDATCTVMGSIELDPASCELANQVVQAQRYYTQEDDGLSKEWIARTLWLNPPFIGGVWNGLAIWVNKLLEAYKSGQVEQAMLLFPVTSNVLTTGWFNELVGYPTCIPPRRTHFYTHDNPNWRPRFGSCITYFGPHTPRFLEVFSPIGRVVQALDTSTSPSPPSSSLVQPPLLALA